MFRPDRRTFVGLALLATMGAGCGLDVSLTASPNPVDQGNPIDFTLDITNQTSCEVSDLVAEVFAFPAGLFPGNFCLDFGTIGDLDEFRQRALDRLPAPLANAMLARADAIQAQLMSGSAGSGQAFVCNEIPDGSVLNFECTLGTLSPNDSLSFPFSGTAPFSGRFDTIALAFGEIPDDEDCSPAFPGQPFVIGCFSSAETVQPAPAVSPIGLGSIIGVLLILGFVQVRRRSRRDAHSTRSPT